MRVPCCAVPKACVRLGELQRQRPHLLAPNALCMTRCHAGLQVTLLESDVRLKSTRLEAAEQTLAAERARHTLEAASLEDQLQSAQFGRASAQSDALAARAEAEEARQREADASASRGRAEAAAAQLQLQHEALQAEHGALKHKVGRPPSAITST